MNVLISESVKTGECYFIEENGDLWIAESYVVQETGYTWTEHSKIE